MCQNIFKPVYDDSKALIVIPTTAVTESNENFDAIAKSGDYLGRLQLMTSSSDPCKKGEFPINHYAVIDDNVLTDLGKQVDIVVLNWRSKALDMSKETVVSVFKPNVVNGEVTNAAFKSIMERSEINNSKCMYGPEFLVWIPSIKRFCTFFMGSKSARRESGKLRNQIGKAMTLTGKEAENAKFTWWTVSASVCSTPIEILPDETSLKNQLEKFSNPPEQLVEEVQESGEERAR